MVVEKKHSFLGTVTIFEGACSFSCANVTCTNTKHSTGYFVNSKLKKPNSSIFKNLANYVSEMLLDV